MNGNYIIFPWNILMMIAVFFLFHRNTDKIEFSYSTWKKDKILNSILVFLLIVPSLNFVGLWDSYASFSLYSGDASNFYMLSKQSIPYLKEHETLEEHLQEGVIIDLEKWSLYELNVPILLKKELLINSQNSLVNLNLDIVFLKQKHLFEKEKY
tara:strand:+ start:12389 stop:12850 length:462 start_codon:yes stop_codon:yes gene_type:complete